jgi:uncharacterized protein YjbJ (UPF0337 family)
MNSSDLDWVSPDMELSDTGGVLEPHAEESAMDKDRIKGSAQQAKGAIKEGVGKITGDAKLKTEGALDKAAGKAKNAVGGMKDAVRNAAKKR